MWVDLEDVEAYKAFCLLPRLAGQLGKAAKRLELAKLALATAKVLRKLQAGATASCGDGQEAGCRKGSLPGGARLVARLVDDLGVRPIACGDVLRKLVAKIILKQRAKTFWGGPGPAVRHPEWVCVEADAKSAFNAVHREAVFEAIERDFPELWA
ncbi:hypothetical protein CYMTET_34382 [Cymbomonas tetramitiformis]|uniref:Reverse transcriptase domain-containing protein n=1 Tax=Cymbomonas tetramitiformis TaxID=36881 RepID=A0AAE0FBN0_9CHLO|nr:hypothetical protein CYMTET_34382 [Cymbomonas tetramitiformis]